MIDKNKQPGVVPPGWASGEFSCGANRIECDNWLNRPSPEKVLCLDRPQQFRGARLLPLAEVNSTSAGEKR